MSTRLNVRELSFSRIIAFLRDEIDREYDIERVDHLMRHRLEAEHELQNARSQYLDY